MGATRKMKGIFEGKKGLQFKSAIFSLITMSMAIIAIGVWVGDWNDQYDSGLEYDLDKYDKLDTLSDYSSDSRQDVSAKTPQQVEDFEGTSLRGAFGVVNNIFTPFDVVFGDGGLIDSIEDRWGIPNYITIGIVSLITLAIIFALIALFFRRPGGTV